MRSGWCGAHWRVWAWMVGTSHPYRIEDSPLICVIHAHRCNLLLPIPTYPIAVVDSHHIVDSDSNSNPNSYPIHPVTTYRSHPRPASGICIPISAQTITQLCIVHRISGPCPAPGCTTLRLALARVGLLALQKPSDRGEIHYCAVCRGDRRVEST
jgi:hypothetical protein